MLSGTFAVHDPIGNQRDMDLTGFEVDPPFMNGKQSVKYVFRPPAERADCLKEFGCTHVVRIRPKKRTSGAQTRFEMQNNQPKSTRGVKKSSNAGLASARARPSDGSRALVADGSGVLSMSIEHYKPSGVGSLKDLKGA